MNGKVIRVEHVCCSYDAFSVESDIDDEVGPMRTSRRVIFDKSAEKVVWQLGMVFEDVKEFREAVTKYSLQKGVQLESMSMSLKRLGSSEENVHGYHMQVLTSQVMIL